MLPVLCVMVTALSEGLCALFWSSRENGVEETLQKLPAMNTAHVPSSHSTGKEIQPGCAYILF